MSADILPSGPYKIHFNLTRYRQQCIQLPADAPAAVNETREVREMDDFTRYVQLEVIVRRGVIFIVAALDMETFEGTLVTVR